MRISGLILAFTCLSTSAAAQEAAEGSSEKPEGRTEVTVQAASSYVTGEVNGQEYDTALVSAGIVMRSGRLFLGASIPYVVTSAPEEFIVSGGGLLGTPLFSQPSSETREVTRDGIGDMVVEAGYSLPLGSFDATIAGNVKIPTASRDKALGSGELDYGVGAQVSRRLGEFVPFASANYTVLGKPDGFDVQNTLSGSAGSHYILGRSTSATLSYVYEESAVKSIADRQSIGLGLDTSVSRQISLGLNASAGLSKDAPDARVGLRLSLGL